MSKNNDNRSKQKNPQDSQFYRDRNIPLPKAKNLSLEQQRKNQYVKVSS
jgi:hypothetical protein